MGFMLQEWLMHIHMHFVPVGIMLVTVTLASKFCCIKKKKKFYEICSRICFWGAIQWEDKVYSWRKAQIRLQSAYACLLTGLKLPPPVADKLHLPICNANLGWAGGSGGSRGGLVAVWQTFNLPRQHESLTVRMSDYPAVCLTCPACWMPWMCGNSSGHIETLCEVSSY